MHNDRAGLMKISQLARHSGVPAATIKYYVREGLLPGPVRKGRNIAYYDPAIVHRIQAIKELQKKRFLPLSVIRQVLDGADPYSSEETERALADALSTHGPVQTRSRQDLLAAGMPAEQLDFFEQVGFITPSGEGDARCYQGDDLQLLRTLAAARRAGLGPDMLPHTIVLPYLNAIRQLVRVELEMFRAGLPNRDSGAEQGGKGVPELVRAATELSERLVIQLRRKLLLPTLREHLKQAQQQGAEDEA